MIQMQSAVAPVEKYADVEDIITARFDAADEKISRQSRQGKAERAAFRRGKPNGQRGGNSSKIVIE